MSERMWLLMINNVDGACECGGTGWVAPDQKCSCSIGQDGGYGEGEN